MKRFFFLPFAGIAMAASMGAIAVFAAASDTTVRGGDTLTVRCDGKNLSSSRIDTKTLKLTCVASATATASASASPSASASASATSTATATATASPSATATATATTTATATATATPPAAGRATIGGCTVFPADNAWNQDVSALPLNANSTNFINTVNSFRQFLHADFGSDPTYGIPYDIVPANQAMVPISFNAYGNQSDPGPYPVPTTAHVEAGSDRHVLVLQQGSCELYEMYNAVKSGSGWVANSGAIFDLNSNALRPAGWTSADAAGLPILPGLVRYDEVKSGVITHALRFTVSHTQMAYIAPATHYASSSTNANYPPMGARLRLKANFDTSAYHGDALVILTALKKYGMIVADNGSDWFISGQAIRPDLGQVWDDNDLNQLKGVPGSAFEVVQTGAAPAVAGNNR